MNRAALFSWYYLYKTHSLFHLPFNYFFQKGFLSHRYGNKFLLPEVKQTDFTAIRNEINNLRLDNSYKGLTETRSLLDHCYKLDENQIPSVYRLLSIKEIIFEYDPNVIIFLPSISPLLNDTNALNFF